MTPAPPVKVTVRWHESSPSGQGAALLALLREAPETTSETREHPLVLSPRMGARTTPDRFPGATTPTNADTISATR